MTIAAHSNILRGLETKEVQTRSDLSLPLIYLLLLCQRQCASSQKRQKHSGIGAHPPSPLRSAQQRPDTHGVNLAGPASWRVAAWGCGSDKKPPLDKLYPTVFKERFEGRAHHAPDGWWWLRLGSYARWDLHTLTRFDTHMQVLHS